MQTFEDLLGKTIVKIEGMEVGSELIKITLDTGDVCSMYHEQDCCERVDLNDINGDVDDLIGIPITMAVEPSSEAIEGEEVSESGTWTFYKLATIKGYVDLRWLGRSNGYYSESVDVYWSKI